jgi:hypothetical protein
LFNHYQAIRSASSDTYYLLISKPAIFTAVRAHPDYGVAGHPPQIFLHALRTYLKTALAGPAKQGFLAADMAAVFFFLPPSPPLSILCL